MTPQEAVSYIENYSWSTTRLGLERTQALLSALGNPQKELKFIHVAGSNGKGSTCAMLASILKSAGYKTGLYISPYIQVFNERIQINGEYIDGERLAEITTRVKAIADEMEDHPSQFELVTAIAILYYYEEKCDIVVLEVGMGGALDSTNAIDAAEVSVFTNIGLEHTEYLGDTLEKIAETKAGIIKTGTTVVCYDSSPEVVRTIRNVCSEKRVPLKLVEMSCVSSIKSSLDGQTFKYTRKSLVNPMGMVTVGMSMIKEEEERYEIPLIGKHQLHNAAVVLRVIDILREKGWKIDEAAVREGLYKVSWPARFEVLSKDPIFILDGGHNPQCAEALTEGIKEYLPNEKVIFVLGVLADKDYGSIVDMMIPYAKEFICVTPLSDRALPAEELTEHLRGKGVKAASVNSIPEGISLAIETSDAESDAPVIAFGSLYLAGAVRTEFPQVYKRYIRRECIEAREELTEKEREDKSEEIVKKILSMDEYKNAKLVMLYKWTNAEVILDELEEENADDDSPKAFAYPLCEGLEMKAILPDEEYGAPLKSQTDIMEEEEKLRAHEEALAAAGDDDDDDDEDEDDIPEGWRIGSFGIMEPTKGFVARPEEIDLVICPCTGFDENMNRLGMGGGFYDRFLPLCKNAKVIAVAYEAQKIARVRTHEHDVPMDAVVTEETIYRSEK